MQPMGKRRTARRERKVHKGGYWGRKSYTPKKNRVCVQWPIVRVWVDQNGQRRENGSWWETAYFRPSEDVLVALLDRALQDNVPIPKAIRCAEAAGLFRRSPKGAW